jgi:hypothetical protein
MGRGGEEDMKRQEPPGKGKQGDAVISTSASKFPSQRMSPASIMTRAQSTEH